MASPLSGQVTVTGTAAALSVSPVQCAAFTIKAASANAGAVYIGGAGVTTSTGYELAAGDTFEYERQIQAGQNAYQLQPSDFYVVGASGSVSWLASP